MNTTEAASGAVHVPSPFRRFRFIVFWMGKRFEFHYKCMTMKVFAVLTKTTTILF